MSTSPPVFAVNQGGSSPFVLLCEHASNHVPARYAGLGLPAAALERHIAWDIGAAAMARRLSVLLDAPLFLSGVSRLVIDCNRPLGTATSIPTRSEATEIPGNYRLDPAERAARAAAYFTPFHDRVAGLLDHRIACQRPTIVVGVHSFTPVFLGVPRPWHAGVLYADATVFGQALVAGLRGDALLVVGDNEPYRIEPTMDYTVPVHGDARGLAAVLLEVRQDFISTTEGIAEWATRLSAALPLAASVPG